MAALREHARLAVFVNGTYLVEVTSIELTTESGQLMVETFEGLAGFTPGSGKCGVKLALAIPISGQEFPFQETAVAGSIVSMQIPVGAKSYIGNGKLIDVGISQSVNASADETVTWQGEFKGLQ